MEHVKIAIDLHEVRVRSQDVLSNGHFTYQSACGIVEAADSGVVSRTKDVALAVEGEPSKPCGYCLYCLIRLNMPCNKACACGVGVNVSTCRSAKIWQVPAHLSVREADQEVSVGVASDVVDGYRVAEWDQVVEFYPKNLALHK